MVELEYIFVYGTLRPPQGASSQNDSRYYFQIKRYIQTAEPAQIENADLFN